MNAGIALADTGNIGLLACAALTTASVAAYAIRGRGTTTMPWWRSPFGLHLMCFMIAFAVVLDESAVFLVTSGQVLAAAAPFRPDWFAWLRVASFCTLIPAVLTWRLRIILRPPGRPPPARLPDVTRPEKTLRREPATTTRTGPLMRAEDAQPGDVVLAPDGQVYQAPRGASAGWSHMQQIGYYGPPGRTAPDGELTLLARDGRPACDHDRTPPE